jgi:ribosomal-protein-alanine N-acetyltransferase
VCNITVITAENFHLYRDRIMHIERASFRTPWGEAAFLGEIANRFSRLWIHQSHGRVDGYICFWRILDEAHLLNLAVDPEARRKGIARRLLTGMLDVCASEGGRSVWLEVRPSNSAALELYQEMGFKHIGRRPLYYSDTGEDALVMGLDLGTQGGKSRVETGIDRLPEEVRQPLSKGFTDNSSR